MNNEISNYSLATNGTGMWNKVDNCIIDPYQFYERVYYPYYQPSVYITEDKFGKAFKILQALMKAKVVEIEKIDKFMESINLIVKEL